MNAYPILKTNDHKFDNFAITNEYYIKDHFFDKKVT